MGCLREGQAVDFSNNDTAIPVERVKQLGLVQVSHIVVSYVVHPVKVREGQSRARPA